MSELHTRLAEKAAVEAPEHNETGGVQDGFQIPGWIWSTMIAAYAVFFLAIAVATGRDGAARFVIVISVGFAVVYFSLAAILASVKGRERRSPISMPSGMLQTYCGAMSRGAVAAQILTVPACIALFAIAILTIRTLVVG